MMAHKRIFVTVLAAMVFISNRAIIAGADDDSAIDQQKRGFRSVVATADHARVLHIRQQPETYDNQPQEAENAYQFIYSAGRFPYHVDRTHSETKDDQGITRGAYSYVDPNRKLQTVRYEANKKEGFKVLSSTLTADNPGVQDTQAVAIAKSKHRALFDHIAQEHARIGEEHARLAAERIKDDDDDEYDDTKAHLRSVEPYSPPQARRNIKYGERLYVAGDD